MCGFSSDWMDYGLPDRQTAFFCPPSFSPPTLSDDTTIGGCVENGREDDYKSSFVIFLLVILEGLVEQRMPTKLLDIMHNTCHPLHETMNILRSSLKNDPTVLQQATTQDVIPPQCN